MPTKLCIFNQATNLIDITDGVAVYTGSPSAAYSPLLLNVDGALDDSFLPTATTSNLGLVRPDGTTITVSGGIISAISSPLNFFSENPAGSAPTTTYTLSHVPLYVIGVYKNGQFMQPGVGHDYTISGSTITFNYSTTSGDIIYVVYTYSSSPFNFFSENPAGSAPTTTYTLSHIPVYVIGVYKNGQLMQPGLSHDYTISGSTITFNYSTASGDIIYAVYIH